MWAVAAGVLVAGIVWLRWRGSGQTLANFLALGCVRAYARLWHGCISQGPDPGAGGGAALLIANHTCSADPTFLQAHCSRPLSFLVAREYYSALPFVGRFFAYMRCVPVARNGWDVAAVRSALRRLGEGRVVCIFPEGGLSAAGRERMRRGKCGAALLALRSRVPVYPAFIADGPQNPHVPRAWLLPSRVRVYFGPPVDLSAYHGRPITRPLLEEVMALLMSRIGALRPKRTSSEPPRSLHCR